MPHLHLQLFSDQCFRPLRRLEVCDLADGDRRLCFAEEAPEARLSLRLPPGPFDLLVMAADHEAMRLRGQLTAPQTHLLAPLPPSDEVWFSSHYPANVAVDFDGMVRWRFAPDGRPLAELDEEEEVLRTFDADGRSQWVWRGWGDLAVLGRHHGTDLDLSLTARQTADGVVLRAVVHNAPAGLRLFAMKQTFPALDARLFDPVPLSAGDQHALTFAKAAAFALPEVGPAVPITLPLPYTRAGDAVSVLAVVPGGPFVHRVCLVEGA